MDPMMQSASFVRHPVLAAARGFSLEWLERMHLAIDAEASGLPGLVTVVTAGSFGRLEASLCSDADVVVVVEDELASDSATARAIHRRLYECLSGLGLLLPKSWGIFTSPTTLAELADPQRLGRLDESPTVFGKRMQILLDSRAAWSPEGLSRVQQGILEWYATAFVGTQPEPGWRLLVCDLVRYWRSYCAWQLFELKADEDDAWILRQVKLGHSRFMNYAGMVCLLGEASRQGGDGRESLLQGLMLTPLDRVRMAYLRAGDAGFAAIEQPYACIVAALEDGATRARMVALSPRQPHELPPALPEDIRALLDAAAEAQAEFARFLQRRNGDWSEGFLRSLLI
jgi:hypothetical protein